MKKEKLKIYLDLLGIVLCLLTIVSLTNYRGLSFFQGFLLKNTLIICSGILFTDLLQSDIFRKTLNRVRK